MPNSNYSDLIKHKKQFFEKAETTTLTSDEILKAFKDDLENNRKKSYEQRLLIEQEFNQLYEVLKEKNNKLFWFWCYQCCLMLELYYSEGKRIQAARYKGLQEEIAKRIDTDAPIDNKDPENTKLLARLKSGLKKDIHSLLTTPAHATKLHDWVSAINFIRLQVIFNRALVSTAVLYAQKHKGLDKISIFGRHTSADQMQKTLAAPTQVMYGFSVGVFMVRLMLDWGMVLNKTFFPPKGIERSFTRWQRFKRATFDRDSQYANDGMWLIINGITNYGGKIGVTAMAAGIISAVFLFFDIMNLLYTRKKLERGFLLKDKQYRAELGELERCRAEHIKILEQIEKANQTNGELRTLEEQKKQLESTILTLTKRTALHQDLIKQNDLDRKVTDSKLQFAMAGACLLGAGFTFSMMAGSTVLLPIAFLVTCLGIAMIMARESFSVYRKNAYIYEGKKEAGDAKETIASLLALKAARNDFVRAIVKQTIMPALLMTVFAISWPAALVLTTAYIAYECLKDYFKPVPVKKAIENGNPALVENPEKHQVPDDEHSGLLPSSQ